MRRAQAGALSLVLLAVAGPASAAGLDGRWSNVCMSRQTGDQGGMEIVLRGGTVASFKVCEGGCWAMPVRDVALEGPALTFTAADQSYDGQGRLVQSRDVRFVGRFSGERLRLGAAGFWEAQVLRRQKAELPGAAAAHPSALPGEGRDPDDKAPGSASLSAI